MSGLCGNNCGRCVLKNKYCGGCSLCEAAVCNKECKSCYALCFNRPEAYSYLRSIGGPKFELRENLKFKIDAHIPILPDRFQEKPKYEIMPTIAVHGGNMFARNGGQINPGYLEKGYAGALNIDERCEAILEFYVKDRTLEGFWDNRKEIYKGLIDMKFKAVISPNFSVYEDAPRLDHLHNIKRTTVIYNEMMDEGINAIPDVSWYNKKDLDRWINEINKNEVRTIAFSFQVVDVKLKASNIWKNYLSGFRYLCENIDPKTKTLIIGISSPRRLLEVHKAASGQSISIINQSAFVQSRRGMLSEGRMQNSRLSKDELFERNMIYFNKVYEEMNVAFTKCKEEEICQRPGLVTR